MEYISILIPIIVLGTQVDKPFDPLIPQKLPYSLVQEQKQVEEKPIIKVETPVVAPVSPIVETPKELTLEEKIAQNVNKCTDSQWIRADNAECLDKYTTPSGYTYTVNYTSNSGNYNTAGNTYAYGYCTWYVKNRRPDLPNQLGNANQWLYNAQRAGYATGSVPRVGAVGQTSAGALGHVVYVEAVNADGTVVVSEMNSVGWNVISTRTASSSDFNYIY